MNGTPIQLSSFYGLALEQELLPLLFLAPEGGNTLLPGGRNYVRDFTGFALSSDDSSLTAMEYTWSLVAHPHLLWDEYSAPWLEVFSQI